MFLLFLIILLNKAYIRVTIYHRRNFVGSKRGQMVGLGCATIVCNYIAFGSFACHVLVVVFCGGCLRSDLNDR